MEGSLQETAIRAWQAAKGGIAMSEMPQTHEVEYVVLYNILSPAN